MSISHDLRNLLRFARAHPLSVGLSFLALVASTTAAAIMWAAIDIVYVRALPIRDPSRLSAVAWSAPTRPSRTVMASYAGYGSTMDGYSLPLSALEALQRDGSGLEGAFGYAPFGYGPEGSTTRAADSAQPITVVGITPQFFSSLGLVPQMGRFFETNEVPLRSPAAPLAVLSDRYWKHRYSEATNIIGQSLDINGASYRIIGVAAAGFDGLEPGVPTDAWVPLSPSDGHTVWGGPSSWISDDKRWTISIFGYVPASTNFQTASAAVGAAVKTAVLGAASIPSFSARLRPAGRGLSDLRSTLENVLMTGVLLTVGLIALAYFAGFSLWHERFASSEHSLRVQLTLGVPVRTIVRSAIVESLAFCLSASLTAVVVATLSRRVAIPALAALVKDAGFRLEPPSSWMELAIPCFIAAGIGAALLTVAHLIRFQALRKQSMDLRRARRSNRQIGGLAVICAATSSVIVVGIGIALISSMWSLYARAGQFHIATLQMATLRPADGAAFGTAMTEQISQFSRNLTPNNDGATFFSDLPFSGSQISAEMVAGSEKHEVAVVLVGPRFASVLQLPLLRGRDIEDLDQSASKPVVLLNQEAAAIVAGNEDVLGRPISLQGFAGPLFVVGVVRSGYLADVRSSPKPTVFLPFGDLRGLRSIGRITVAWSGERSASVRSAIDRSLHQVCPGCGLVAATTGADRLHEVLARERLQSVVATGAILVCLAVSAVLVVGSFVASVRQHAVDFAIRRAMGANQRALVTTLLSAASALTWPPLLVGPIAIVVGVRSLQAQATVAATISPALCAAGACATSIALVAIAVALSAKALGRQDLATLLRG